MRIIVPLVAGSLLAACASQPKSETPPPAADLSKLPITVATNGPVTGEKILALQREGYKLVDRDGQIYFCRNEKKLGSNIARETICMTEKQIDELRDQTQRRLGEVVRQRPPPQGK